MDARMLVPVRYYHWGPRGPFAARSSHESGFRIIRLYHGYTVSTACSSRFERLAECRPHPMLKLEPFHCFERIDLHGRTLKSPFSTSFPRSLLAIIRLHTLASLVPFMIVSPRAQTTSRALFPSEDEYWPALLHQDEIPLLPIITFDASLAISYAYLWYRDMLINCPANQLCSDL